MELQEKVSAIIEELKVLYPDPMCALHYKKDYELMIAVRLSAQCTDERVNMITPALFERFPTLEAMAAADVKEVEELVHSCGFFRQKASDIVGACKMLLELHDGKVPATMEELLKLPGVGRKTANLLLGDLYRTPGSVVCDTTASASPTVWVLPWAKNRRRWKSNCGRFCPRRNPLISATGSSCTAEPSAPPASPTAPAAPWRPVAHPSR